MLPTCQDKLALCVFFRTVGMQPFLRGSNCTSHELSVNISKMQIILGCGDKHFDIQFHTLFLRDYCLCRPCPYIMRCAVFPNKDTFLTCLVCHFAVLKFIAENAVTRVSWGGRLLLSVRFLKRSGSLGHRNRVCPHAKLEFCLGFPYNLFGSSVTIGRSFQVFVNQRQCHGRWADPRSTKP